MELPTVISAKGKPQHLAHILFARFSIRMSAHTVSSVA
uniref:Uncharacterized protein n=1 Tax=Arundo donax TaxID=35708 RepID=A0A0A9F135_ARUDO